MTRREFCDHHWRDLGKRLHVCQRLKGHHNGCQCECGATDKGKPAPPQGRA